MPPQLIVRLKSHFHSLPCGADLIIGLNGFIWVEKPRPRLAETGATGAEATSSAGRDDERTGMDGLDGEMMYSDLNDVRRLGLRFCLTLLILVM